MITLMRSVALAAAVVTAAVIGCSNDRPPPQMTGAAGIGGVTGNGGSGGSSAANTIKLETWMDGIAKNAEVDVNVMPDNVLYTVTDKQPVTAAEAAAVAQEPGKLTVVYDEDPAKLRFLFEADPRFEAP
jgi:hypothetical protein